MRYLDANGLVYATADDGEVGEAARRILRETRSGRTPAVTAVLTLDEVAWEIRRLEDDATALRETTRLLAFPNLYLLDVKAKHIVGALDLMEQHETLRPREALHAAVAIDAGVFSLVSTDSDFDAIPQLDRIPLVGGGGE